MARVHHASLKLVLVQLQTANLVTDRGRAKTSAPNRKTIQLSAEVENFRKMVGRADAPQPMCYCALSMKAQTWMRHSAHPSSLTI